MKRDPGRKGGDAEETFCGIHIRLTRECGSAAAFTPVRGSRCARRDVCEPGNTTLQLPTALDLETGHPQGLLPLWSHPCLPTNADPSGSFLDEPRSPTMGPCMDGLCYSLHLRLQPRAPGLHPPEKSSLRSPPDKPTYDRLSGLRERLLAELRAVDILCAFAFL